MMGMSRIKRGTGFRGALNYAMDKGDLIGGNMSGTTSRELAAEFKAVRQLRPDIKKPVWHEALRLPDGEQLQPEKWNEIADDFMKRLGFADTHPRAYILHDDKEGQHIHIVASRIAIDGSIYLGQNENLKATSIIRQLELDYKLTPFTPDPNKPKCKPISAGERGLAERTGEVPMKIRLQAIIDEAVLDHPYFETFISRLDGAGVMALPSGKTGQPQGVSFSLEGVAFKGSDLGKSYAWKGLKDRIDYEPGRDQYIIDDLRKTAADGSEEEASLSPGLSPTPQPNGPKRTLDLAFERNGDVWVWKGRDTAAFIDRGDYISINSKSDTAIRAALQLARQKWGNEINVTGNANYCRNAWLIGSQMGLKVTGYEPTEKDKVELEQIKAAREAQRNERKNSKHATTSTGRGPDENPDNRGTVGDDRAPSVKPGQFDGGNSWDNAGWQAGSDGHTERGGISENNGGLLGDLQTATTGTDHSRSSGVADDVNSINSWSSTRSVSVRVDRVEAIAAPVSDRSQDRAERQGIVRHDQEPIAPDYAIKLAAWRSQHEALDAPAYRITLVDRDPERIKKHGRMGLGYVLGKKTGNDIKTADEVEAAISTLRRENARNFDIYITPIDDKNHYVLIDDIHEEKDGKLTKFRIDSFKPALIQFSSNDNYQAILKVPGIDGDHDFTNDVFQKLNTVYGEPGIKGGAVHPFRMAGFANKKPGKGGFTQLIETKPGAICEKTGQLIRLAIENHDAEKKAKDIEKEKNRRLKAIENHNADFLKPGVNNDVVLLAYKKSFNKTLGLAKKHGWDIDYSKIDFAVTKDLIKHGYRSDLIEKAIVDGSPNIEQRKGQHIDGYAKLTVQNAAISKDVIEHKQRQAERGRDQDRGFEL